MSCYSVFMEMFRNHTSPEKPKIKEMNDLRPVALTSVPMKCLERLVLYELRKVFDRFQDPLQFAYRSKRSVDDAILIFLDNIYKHIDIPRNYCRILFIDFSSAFNTIQPHILYSKLVHMKVNKCIIAWIMEFLTNRPQYVKFQNVSSNYIHTNTGAPQGCVISPVLFTIYTNDCSVNENETKLLKFADDSTIQGLISSSEQHYRDTVKNFTSWCDEHFLLLNIKKTKELIIDFRLKKDPLDKLTIKNESVEVVKTYKYLGVTIDDELDWHTHSNITFKKMNQRLFFLRKLRSFNIDSTILYLFYKSCIESLLLFCLCGFGGNYSIQDKNKFNKIIKKACKISGNPVQVVTTLFDNLCIKKIMSICADKSHPLSSQVTTSPRSGRVILLRTNRERYKNSFLPYAMKLLSTMHQR